MSENNESCTWQLDCSTDSTVWETDCGEAFVFEDGGPVDKPDEVLRLLRQATSGIED